MLIAVVAREIRARPGATIRERRLRSITLIDHNWSLRPVLAARISTPMMKTAGAALTCGRSTVSGPSMLSSCIHFRGCAVSAASQRSTFAAA
jgi:hypothetical protein